MYHPKPEREWGGPFEQLNRGKRSVVLNLKDAQDLARMQKLLAHADIFVLVAILPLEMSTLLFEFCILTGRMQGGMAS